MIKMPCKICGSDIVRYTIKYQTIAGIVNQIGSFYCTNCGNLVYGYCRPLDKEKVIKDEKVNSMWYE